ncbi:MAG: phage protein Gp37 [Syntrophobacteraceae bacterium]
MPAIAEIENAILERLRASLPYLRTCGSLSEFLGRDLDAIEEMAPLCPAAFVIYEQGTYSQKMSGVQDREMHFCVILAVRNLRGESALRHGSPGQKGIYDVLEDVRAALSEQSCGVEIDPLSPVTEEAVSGSRDFAVYEILFRTRCRVAP